MTIQGIRNKVKFGQLLPNEKTKIDSLKSFFYKAKDKTEEEIKIIISKDDRIIFEDNPAIVEKPKVEKVEKKESKVKEVKE